ncbi:MAG TPA: acylphosphatase [Ignavibacteria bacterium]|nr:acylphosphatase [Ignavibacteria bacterium]
MEKKVNITVKGLVQGVGFRFFCKRKAIEYNLTGYVKNLFSGDVEIVIEGNSNLINDFLKDIKIGPLGAIVKSVLTEESDYQNEYSDFRIL